MDAAAHISGGSEHARASPEALLQPRLPPNLPAVRRLPCLPQVPVVEGAHKSLRGAAKERIADFVHGSDGFGNARPQLAEVGADAVVWVTSSGVVCGGSKASSTCF